MIVNKPEILKKYTERLKLCEDAYEDTFERIKNARYAFDQILPEDIKYKSTDAYSQNVGNDPDGEKVESQSQIMVPIFTAIAKKIMEDLNANPIRPEVEANNSSGETIKDSVEQKMTETFTQENIMQRLLYGYRHAVIDGVMISQVVAKEMTQRLIYPDGKTKAISMGMGIDIVVYDPLTTFMDPNCLPHNPRKTSEFIIVTIGKFDEDYIKQRYGEDVAAGIASTRVADNYKKSIEKNHGVSKETSVVVREYYLKNGMCYVVVGDSVIVEERTASNGCGDMIPINIAPLHYSSENPYGIPLWYMVAEPVAMMSRAMNQIADNNALNNYAPFVLFKGSQINAYTLNSWRKNAVIEIAPSANRNASIEDVFTKLSYPDMSQSALFMYNQALQMLFYVTGTNPMAFGVQDKQIRTNDVANLMASSMIRSDSDIAKKIEIGFMNPVMWDILRIFAVHYERFEFDPNLVPPTFLENIKNVRVVNGSYLPEDKMNRMGRASALRQFSAQNPAGYDLGSVETESLKSIGYSNPNKYIKSPNEVRLEQQMLLMNTMLSMLQQGQQVDPKYLQQLNNEISMLLEIVNKENRGEIQVYK